MGRGSNDWVLLTAGFVLGALVVLVFVGPWPDVGGPDGAPTQPFWRFVSHWQTMFTGIFAGLAALIAARVAWLSVQRQLHAARLDRRHERAMVVKSMATDLNTASYSLVFPHGDSEALIASARAKLMSVDAIDINIGTFARVVLHGADQANALARKVVNSRNAITAEEDLERFEVQSKPTALRIRIVAHMLHAAATAYAEGRAFTHRGSVARSVADDAIAELGTDDLGHFAEMVAPVAHD